MFRYISQVVFFIREDKSDLRNIYILFPDILIGPDNIQIHSLVMGLLYIYWVGNGFA